MSHSLRIEPLIALSILLATLVFNTRADDSHIGEGAQNLPIFDAHIHYKEPA